MNRTEAIDHGVFLNGLLSFGGRRLPVIRQDEAGECGLACLAMIASFHGRNETLSDLRQRYPLSINGTTLKELVSIADSLGFASRGLRFDLADIARLHVPAIVHWDMDHFVVLRRVSRGKVFIHDPSAGARTMSLGEASPHVTGIALELRPSEQFQAKKRKPEISLRKLIGRIDGLAKGLGIVVVLTMVLEALALLTPQFLQAVVDHVIVDGDHDLLALIGTGFILAVALQAIFSAARTWIMLCLSSHFTLSWSTRVFSHLLRLPQAYFMKRHLGDVVSRFGAVAAIQHGITGQLVTGLFDGFMSVVTLTILIAYSPRLAGMVVGAMAIYALLRALYFASYRESNLSQITKTAKQQTLFIESVRASQTLRLFNAVPARVSRFANVTADVVNTGVAVQKLDLIFSTLGTLATGAQKVGLLWVGGIMALNGKMTAGMLMAFVAYADQFVTRCSGLIEYGIQWRLMTLQSERLADIVLASPEIAADSLYVGPAPTPSIRFEDVSFRYAPSSPWIIRHMTFEVEAGTSVAIVGPSGCGKTTVLKLLLGLLEPDEGRVMVGGMDIQQIGKKAIRSMIGTVMQDDAILAGTMAENVAFFDPAASLECIERACHLAEIHADIAAMPLGYHTPVGDMGSSLSGGQRQRLLLARALYREPAMMILDEATSHLDVSGEKAIMANLASFRGTRVVVAHRPETIQAADRVLAFEGGALQASEPTKKHAYG